MSEESNIRKGTDIVKNTVIHFLLVSFALIVQNSLAGSATWNLNPTTGDWNTATNWTPATVPNGPADIASLDNSSQTGLSVSAPTEVSEIVFNPGASAFTIAPKASTQVNVLTISGAGIINNSGITQNLATNSHGFKTSEIHFTNAASAGTGTYITNHGNPVAGLFAYTQFFNNATAGSATIVNEIGGGWVGQTIFNDTSNAGNATLITAGGSITFRDGSSAANATFSGNGGFFFFEDTSSAGNGVFTLGGPDAGTTTPTVSFAPETTAANAIFIVKGGQASSALGGLIFFDGNSDHATVTVDGGAVSGALGGALQFDAGTAGSGNFTINGASITGAAGATVAFTEEAAGGNAIFKLAEERSEAPVAH